MTQRSEELGRKTVEWGYRSRFHGKIVVPTSGLPGAIEGAAREQSPIYRREVVTTDWLSVDLDDIGAAS